MNTIRVEGQFKCSREADDRDLVQRAGNFRLHFYRKAFFAFWDAFNDLVIICRQFISQGYMISNPTPHNNIR